jgi:hypothetical protein
MVSGVDRGGGSMGAGAAAAIAGGASLNMYFALLMWSRFNPRRRRSAHDAMGEGCATIIAFGVAGIGVLLTIAWYLRFGVIVRLIGAVTTLIGVQLVGSLVFEAFKSGRKRRQVRGRPGDA